MLNCTVIIEAVTVSIIVLIINLILNEYVMNSNENFYEFSLLSGFIIHIICEITEINKYYCKNGNACKNNQEN